MRTTKDSWGIDLLFLVVTLFCLFFALLGVRPLFTPDEGRYAEIAREMIIRHDYITPYLNDIKYFEKPALFYWLTAGSIKVFGLNLWSVRLVNAFLAMLGAIATYVTARLLYDRFTGLLAAFMLSTSLLYFVMAHMVSLDLPVTVFLSICLYAFLLGTRYPSQRQYLMWLAAAASGCAVLTKGLIGIVFPGMIITVWLAMTGEWRKLKYYYLPSSLVIFLLVALPWHMIVSQRNPEFFYFYFIEQQFLRYTTMDIGHYQPVWFFIPCLLAGFIPWITFLPQSLAWQFREKTHLFFLLWAVLVFCFFSFSKSKLIPYILPIFPALAMMTSHYLANACSKKTTRSIKVSFLMLALLALGIAYLLYDFVSSALLPDKATALLYLGIASVILVTGTIGAWLMCGRHLRAALITLIGTAFVFLILVIAAVPSVDSRTILPLATKLKSVLTPKDDVITYNQYYQDLPFYLERRITILNWRNEMTQGMQTQDTSAWMITDTEFWRRWNSKQRIFVIMSKNEYEIWQKRHPKIKPHLISETLTNVLLCNYPVH